MNYIADYFNSRAENPYPAYLICTAFVLGALQVTSMALKTLSFLYRHTIKTQKNFADRYNQGDSWVVVTGGSDGIGEQFCKDLANQGFNICIIARNEEKIKQKLQGIQASVKNGKKIKTRYIVADLANATKYEEYK